MRRNNSRLSLGGGTLFDSSPGQSFRSSSVPKRMSLGGSVSNTPSEQGAKDSSVKKDRRVLLEEWRKQVRSRETYKNTSNISGMINDDTNSKRPRKEYNSSPAQSAALPIPPHYSAASGSSVCSGNSTSNFEGTTAVERFRMRRQQRQSKRSSPDENIDPITMPPQPASSSKQAKICFDDDDDQSEGISSNNSSGATPSFSRRLTISSGARRRSTRGRKSLVPMNFNEKENNANADKNEVCAPEGPGVQSKIIIMEKRIQDLEKEKITLAMSKAPLEARLRQKEDLWIKEKHKYELEITALKSSSKEVNEKLKNLEMQCEGLEEEAYQLRYEARKTKVDNSSKDDDSCDVWNRQLQNDRDVSDLKEKLRCATEEIKSLRLEKVSIESEINATNLELSALMRDFDDLQSDYEELLSKKESNNEAEIQLEELTKEHTATTAQLNATSGELASLKSQSKFDMNVKEQAWQEEKEKLLFDMSVLKSRVITGETYERSSISSDIEDKAVLKARIEERDRRIIELEAQLLEGEQIRRTMHNRIQELRGNIRVFVRTRPFLPEDKSSSKSCIEDLGDGETLSIVDQKTLNESDFKFDKVFPPSSGQDAVFDEVSEFVQSALDGYHVCLFSYGQTGSGKTHTMQGSGNGAMRGIIPRAVEQILSQVKTMKNQKWSFNMTASFLEIYNEELHDLLGSMKESLKSASKSRACRKPPKLCIRRNSSGKSFVDGLSQVDIDTDNFDVGINGLKEVMVAASRARSVASTKMNSQSSRSHSVFILNLNGTNEDSGAIVKGALNLCDLAGSERLDRSGASSDAKRLKETQAINKSLSCLGDVFNALASGASHIPFRNSKLTYLLQDCLSGDGKALMFVNLSPTQESCNESICSLRFATRVNQVELGKATKNIKFVRKKSA
eukprot:CAMPEP_0184866166 /NCGR_PEP_ID=MMETSP0580-20130426/21150_1 /TAXON_ID=1118495 /ORGANISM="Dactyliosolen fragilissimus" /LENGTH=904 /DNA_ID=CAMNT_0027365689 /DNA_START=54 /DNA_END=2768 /DNA_ORIENTATION=-